MKIVFYLCSQLFGVFVSYKTWADFWLVIGLSKYVSLYFLQSEFGNNEFRYTIIKQTQKVYELENYSQPLYCETVAHVSDYYSTYLFKKSPLVLYMLEKIVKPVYMKKVVSALIVSALQGLRLVSTRHFLKEISKTYNVDLKHYQRYWIYGTGIPYFQCAFTYDADRNVIDFFIKQIVSHVNQKKYVGELAIKVHEMEGPKDHVIAINDTYNYGELTCTTKAVKKQKRKAKEQGKDEEDRIQLPFSWIRLDPNLELIHVHNFRQTEELWLNQLERDKDVVAQLEAAHALPLCDSNTTHAVTKLQKCLQDMTVYYRVRVACALNMSRFNDPTSKTAAQNLLLAYFKNHFYHRTANEITAMSEFVSPNDFSDYAMYYIKKSLPIAIGQLRDENDQIPMEVLQFLFYIYEYNDNSENEYSDMYYVINLIRGLTLACASIRNEEERIKQQSTVVMYVKELLELDQLIPSYSNHICKAMIQLSQLYFSNWIPFHYSNTNNTIHAYIYYIQHASQVMYSSEESDYETWKETFLYWMQRYLFINKNTSHSVRLVKQLLVYCSTCVRELEYLFQQSNGKKNSLSLLQVFIMECNSNQGGIYFNCIWNLLQKCYQHDQMIAVIWLWKLIASIWNSKYVHPMLNYVSQGKRIHHMNYWMEKQYQCTITMTLSIHAELEWFKKEQPSTTSSVVVEESKKKKKKKKTEEEESLKRKGIEVEEESKKKKKKKTHPIEELHPSTTGDVTPNTLKLKLKVASFPSSSTTTTTSTSSTATTTTATTTSTSTSKSLAEEKAIAQLQYQQQLAIQQQVDTSDCLVSIIMNDFTIYIKLYFNTYAMLLYKSLPFILDNHTVSTASHQFYFTLPNIEAISNEEDEKELKRQIISKHSDKLEIAYWKDGNSIVMVYGKTMFDHENDNHYTRLYSPCPIIGYSLFNFKEMAKKWVQKHSQEVISTFNTSIRVKRLPRIVMSKLSEPFQEMNIDLYDTNASNALLQSLQHGASITESATLYGDMMCFALHLQSELPSLPSIQQQSEFYRNRLFKNEIALWYYEYANHPQSRQVMLLVGSGPRDLNEVKPSKYDISLTDKCLVVGRVVSGMNQMLQLLKQSITTDVYYPFPTVLCLRKIKLEMYDSSGQIIGTIGCTLHESVTADAIYSCIPKSQTSISSFKLLSNYGLEVCIQELMIHFDNSKHGPKLGAETQAETSKLLANQIAFNTETRNLYIPTKEDSMELPMISNVFGTIVSKQIKEITTMEEVMITIKRVA